MRIVTMNYIIPIILTVYCANTNVYAQSRISGGAVADIAQFPFSVALLNNIGSTGFRQVCGGTILSTSAILSAASCFVINNQITPAFSWRARVGGTFSHTQGLLFIISRITTHPEFVSVTRVNDIAVLRTAATIGFRETIQPALIAGRFYPLAQNDVVWAIGWGATSATSPSSTELRQVQIWVNSQQVCAERYRTLNFNVTDNMICAGWLDVGIRGQCLGDTGSPLLHNNVVVGVYSWTEGCGNSLFPNINTRVAAYTRWIEATATA